MNRRRMIVILLCVLALLGILAACQVQADNLSAASGPSLATAEPSATPEPATATPASPCGLPAVENLPEVVETPVLNQEDPATGLHYTGGLANIDVRAWRLKVTGAVDTELELTYEELRCLPKVVSEEILYCEGFFKDVATWGGVSISELLKLAGVQPGATEVRLVANDGYATILSLEEANAPNAYLAYELEGDTLPRLHGFPLRAVLGDETGYKWVKWLAEIQVR